MRANLHPLHSFTVHSFSFPSPAHHSHLKGICSRTRVPWTSLGKSLNRSEVPGLSDRCGSAVQCSGSGDQALFVHGDDRDDQRLVPDSENPATPSHEADRPPLDLDLAVILAGFAFEAYTTPPDNIGRREIDAAGCQTVFLSELFLREIYDGQFLIKLKKAVELPAMDPWGTSDPYVVFQLEGQVVKSNIKWATKEPIWNEDLTLNIKRSPSKLLQIAAWDANLITPHKRMGNSGIDVTSLCDGNSHDLVVDLEGPGGGGKIYLEVLYKTFDQIDEEKKWWKIPFVSDFFMQNNLASSLKLVLGVEKVNVSQFVQFAFGQMNSLMFSSLDGIQSSDKQLECEDCKSEGQNLDHQPYPRNASMPENNNILDINSKNIETISSNKVEVENLEETEIFWKNLADSIDKSIIQKLGFPNPISLKWDRFDLLNKTSMLLQNNAEKEYIQSGLVTPTEKESIFAVENDDKSEEPPSQTGANSLAFDINKTSRDVLGQTESVLGALMVLASAFSDQKKNESSAEDVKEEDVGNFGISGTSNKVGSATTEISELEKAREEDTRKLFSCAESAMEAWALLATSLGQNTFIKSEFEKICFLDNDATDTQVAIWRDPSRRRLVIAFRGTEQVRWKDLRTDLMLLPSGEDNNFDSSERWHVYVTGHSLGGALATLLAFELSSSRMAKCGAISITMYNFGSPRVGNRRFVEVYNRKVKDSWRIVNHRDIVPTVPRLMGYCHVAQPVYLASGDVKNALLNMELSQDGYEGEMIGEYTPDVLVNEFMKGERELIEKILQMEINLFRSIRDGTALMQHMEDFYYITLLETVRSRYKSLENAKSDDSNELVS